MPLTRADVDAVNALRKAGRIEEARSLLRSIDDDKARAALIKFNERYPEAEPLKISAEPPEKKQKPPLSTSEKIWGGIFAIVVIGCIAAFAIAVFQAKQQDAEIGRQVGMEIKLGSICFQAYYFPYYNKLGSDKFNDACDKEVKSTITLYGATVGRCYDTWKEEEKKLEDCLADGGAKFSGVYMDIASVQ